MNVYSTSSPLIDGAKEEEWLLVLISSPLYGHGELRGEVPSF